MKNRYWLIVGLMTLLVFGCSVTSHQIERAEELCSSHGGLRYLVATASSKSAIEAMCNDGTKVMGNNE